MPPLRGVACLTRDRADRDHFATCRGKSLDASRNQSRLSWRHPKDCPNFPLRLSKKKPRRIRAGLSRRRRSGGLGLGGCPV